MICHDKNGRRQYILSPKRRAVGGEGEIYDIIGQPNLVAKIYKPGKTGQEKERKLFRMINFQPVKSVLSQIAWPQDVLYNAGQFIGFTMQKVNINEDLNVIYEYGPSAKYHNMRWETKIIIAKNICAVLYAIHNSNHVCGDLNPKNISVDPQSCAVVFLDTDSYHILDGVYRCGVGTPGYLPIEILRKIHGKYDLVTAPLPTFSPDTDNFALAIHIFQLLMNGVHPFACARFPSISSIQVPQPSENIENGECPFMQNIPGMRIPVFAPPITILPSKTQYLFKRAFVDGHKCPSIRPKPEEWHDALEELRQELKNCSNIMHHQYNKNLSSCPWCAVNGTFSQQTGVIQTQIIHVPTSLYGTTVSSSRSTQTTNGWWQRFSKWYEQLSLPAKIVLIVFLLCVGILWFDGLFTRKPPTVIVSQRNQALDISTTNNPVVIHDLADPFPLTGTKWEFVDQNYRYILSYITNYDVVLEVFNREDGSIVNVEPDTGRYKIDGDTLTEYYKDREERYIYSGKQIKYLSDTPMNPPIIFTQQL
jgi:serine/threonine protein kinase